MPLAKDIPSLRRELEQQLTEDLPAAINALKARLPDNSEKYRLVATLLARLNDANKERFRNTISMEEYQRRCDQVRADFFDLLAMLEEADFDPEAAQAKPDDENAVKTGTVLYRIPDHMPLGKLTRCTVRVAIDEEAILENIILDDQVQVKSQIEVSDVMSAELVDPEGNIFKIMPLNAHTQLVRDTGYTEWLFGVTPLIEGVHQLLVKVSIMEVVPGFAEPVPREVSVLETVTIFAEAEAPGVGKEAPMKAAGLALSFAGGNPAKAASGPTRTPVPANVPGAVMAQGLRRLLAFVAIAAVVTIAAIFIVPRIKSTFSPPQEQPPPDTSAVENEQPKDASSPAQNPPQDINIQPDTGGKKPPAEMDPARPQSGPGKVKVPVAPAVGKKPPAEVNPVRPQSGPDKVELARRRSGFEMLPVEGGTFEMGQRDTSMGGTGFSKDECPHEVKVGTFRMGKYEVTQADWEEIMGGNPSFNKDCDECPVERVSWDDVQIFIKKANEKFNANHRLPSEKNRRYAARGGNRSKNYKYAGSNILSEICQLLGMTRPWRRPSRTKQACTT